MCCGLPFTDSFASSGRHHCRLLGIVVCLSLVHGVCCIENSDLADEHAKCRDTPKTRLPEWLRESEYFKDPPVGEEGKATGVAGTNPAGWKTYGLGLKPHLDL